MHLVFWYLQWKLLSTLYVHSLDWRLRDLNGTRPSSISMRLSTWWSGRLLRSVVHLRSSASVDLFWVFLLRVGICYCQNLLTSPKAPFASVFSQTSLQAAYFTFHLSFDRVLRCLIVSGHDHVHTQCYCGLSHLLSYLWLQSYLPHWVKRIRWDYLINAYGNLCL